MADQSNDPLALWQKMIGEMEKGFNAFANQAMASPQFSKAINQAGGLTAPPTSRRQRTLSDIKRYTLARPSLFAPPPTRLAGTPSPADRSGRVR